MVNTEFRLITFFAAKDGETLYSQQKKRLLGENQQPQICDDTSLMAESEEKHPLPRTQEKTTHGHHQMVNTEIRLIIFFAAKDGEALYNQQKQDWELTVPQIMNSLN